jgi:hypothetical protein
MAECYDINVARAYVHSESNVRARSIHKCNYEKEEKNEE